MRYKPKPVGATQGLNANVGVAPPAAPATADLQARLLDRERRLAELTEHCLSILDELGAAKGQVRGKEDLRVRAAKLEELLADTRARVRAAASIRLQLPAGATSGSAPFAVVVWGAAGAADAALAATLTELGEAKATVIVAAGDGGEETAAAGRLARRDGVTVLEAAGPTPAAAWNQGCAATDAPVVVFVRAGAKASQGALAGLAAVAAAAGTALATPMLQRGKRRWLGLAEKQPFVLERRDADRAEPVQRLSYASPELFALSRDALHRLGPFDQDLRTELALAEWAARAHGEQLRVLGVRDAVVEAGPGPAPGEERGEVAADEADRLCALARHRPDEVAASALAMEPLWREAPDAVAAALRAALLRLQQAALPQAVELLVQNVQHLARAAAANDPHTAIERLQREVAAAEEARKQAAAALREREAEIQALRRSADAIHTDFAKAQDAVRVLKDEIIARDGATHALKDQLLAQTRAIADLEQAVANLLHERSLLQADRDSAREEGDAAEAESEQARQQAEAAVREAASSTRKSVETAMSHQAGLAAINRLTAIVAAAAAGTATPKDADGADAEHLPQVAALEQALALLLGRTRERDGWLADLLREVQQRRWSGRALHAHEREFLARYDEGDRGAAP